MSGTPISSDEMQADGVTANASTLATAAAAAETTQKGTAAAIPIDNDHGYRVSAARYLVPASKAGQGGNAKDHGYKKSSQSNLISAAESDSHGDGSPSLPEANRIDSPNATQSYPNLDAKSDSMFNNRAGGVLSDLPSGMCRSLAPHTPTHTRILPASHISLHNFMHTSTSTHVHVGLATAHGPGSRLYKTGHPDGPVGGGGSGLTPTHAPHAPSLHHLATRLQNHPESLVPSSAPSGPQSLASLDDSQIARVGSERRDKGRDKSPLDSAMAGRKVGGSHKRPREDEPGESGGKRAKEEEEEVVEGEDEEDKDDVSEASDGGLDHEAVESLAALAAGTVQQVGGKTVPPPNLLPPPLATLPAGEAPVSPAVQTEVCVVALSLLAVCQYTCNELTRIPSLGNLYTKHIGPRSSPGPCPPPRDHPL